MLRALLAFVGVMLAVGVYALLAGPGEPAHAAAPSNPGPASFGFALAAGAVALGVTLMISRPRTRMRR